MKFLLRNPGAEIQTLRGEANWNVENFPYKINYYELFFSVTMEMLLSS